MENPIFIKPLGATNISMSAQSRRKVVILESNHVINAGLKRYLIENSEHDVIGLENDDFDQMFEHAEELNPDVIIMDLSSADSFMSMLLDNHMNLLKVKTIIFDLDSDNIQVYEKFEVKVHKMSDFLAILET